MTLQGASPATRTGTSGLLPASSPGLPQRGPRGSFTEHQLRVMDSIFTLSHFILIIVSREGFICPPPQKCSHFNNSAPREWWERGPLTSALRGPGEAELGRGPWEARRQNLGEESSHLEFSKRPACGSPWTPNSSPPRPWDVFSPSGRHVFTLPSCSGGLRAGRRGRRGRFQPRALCSVASRLSLDPLLVDQFPRTRLHRAEGRSGKYQRRWLAFAGFAEVEQVSWVGGLSFPSREMGTLSTPGH